MKERPRGGYHWLKTTLSGSAPVVLTWSRGEEDEKWRTSPSVLHWYKNEKYNTRVEDEEGCPVFSLVNKAIGEALKHSIGVSHLVKHIREKYGDYFGITVVGYPEAYPDVIGNDGLTTLEVY